MPEDIVADWSLRFLPSVDNTVMHCRSAPEGLLMF